MRAAGASPVGPYDVVIVGAGPVGVTAANIAAVLGLRVAALDQATEVYPLPRAVHFDADVMRILQFVGLADDVERITRPGGGGLHLGMDGQPIRDLRVPPQRGSLGWKPHYFFYQPEFETLLRLAAVRAGADLRLGWNVERVEQTADGARVHVHDPEGDTQLLEARYVVACDGASSSTRKRLGIALDDFGFDEPWIIIDVRLPREDVLPAYNIQYCNPARPASYVVGPGRHRRWEFMLLPGETAAEMERPESIAALLAPWVAADEVELIRTAVYRFHALVATEWRRGRIFLAGDSAHQTPPFFGQGMCHGMRDVRNLLWKIALVLDGAADDALLDTYQMEREPHVRAIIDAAVSTGRYICTLDSEQAARRDAEFRAQMAAGTSTRSFRDIIPALEGGLLRPLRTLTSAAGEAFIQPYVRADHDCDMLLDDLLGDGLALVTRDPQLALASSVSSGLERALGFRRLIVSQPDQPPRQQELGAIRVTDTESALNQWFDAHKCEAALIRPDRYVYATARDCNEAQSHLARLTRQLGHTE